MIEGAFAFLATKSSIALRMVARVVTLDFLTGLSTGLIRSFFLGCGTTVPITCGPVHFCDFTLMGDNREHRKMFGGLL